MGFEGLASMLESWYFNLLLFFYFGVGVDEKFHPFVYVSGNLSLFKGILSSFMGRQRWGPFNRVLRIAGFVS